jgi:regulatory protein
MDHKITALKLQKHNLQRVNVYLDGEFAFGLSRLAAAWLVVDQQISDEKIALLQAQDAFETAYQQALNFLNYRQRSQAEVRKNLQIHQVPDQIIASVLERLKSNGLVDDHSFAQIWVENRAEFRPRSKKALISELRQHGLDNEMIDQAVEQVNEDQQAYQAAVKHLNKMDTTEWQEFRKRLTNYLLRRGFSFDVINPVVHKVWEEKQTNKPGIKD